MRSSPSRYSPLSIALHWAMLVLLALVYAFVELRVFFPRGTPERDFLRAAHFGLGLTVLLFVLPRLFARWRGGRPPIRPALSASQHLASTLVQALLYAFMLGMPLAGWLLLSLRGDPVPFFGLEMPPLARPDEAAAKALREWHGLAGRIGYGLVALHALAALFHHYVRRDNTLERMRPGA